MHTVILLAILFQEPHFNRDELLTDAPVVLPPIDSQSQLRIRRSIVLEALDKVLPPILAALRLSPSVAAGLLRQLVNTLK